MKYRIRVAAIITSDNNLLLVKHKKDDSIYWLLPGGGLEAGETLIEALEREVLEETSLTIKQTKLIFISDSISPLNEKHIVQLVFKCEIESGELSVNPDYRLCDAKFVSFSRIKDISLRPNIKKELIEYLENGYSGKLYLGNVWE